MNRVRNLLFSLFIVPMLLGMSAHAQKGSIKMGKAVSKGIQPDGQLPIANFQVYLVTPGNGTNKAATSLISCAYDGVAGTNVSSDDNDNSCYVLADGNGGFNLTGLYNNQQDGTGCTAGAAQPVYIEVRQGTVGGTTNPKLAFMGILPSAWNCDYIADPNNTNVFFILTDFTNVMAGIGAAPFANFTNGTSFDGLSAAGGAGLTAFAAAADSINAVVPINSGYYAGYGATSNFTTLQRQFNTLADIISTCLTTNGSGTPCSSLFTDTTDTNTGFNGSGAPADTWQAMASIGQDPSNNVTNLFNLPSGNVPYQPQLSSAPSSGFAITVAGAPFISSLSRHTAIKGSNNTILINGSNLVNASGACPIVAIDGQKAVVVPSSCFTGATSITVQMPTLAGRGALEVYANGLGSNAMYFNITNN